MTNNPDTRPGRVGRQVKFPPGCRGHGSVHLAGGKVSAATLRCVEGPSYGVMRLASTMNHGQAGSQHVLAHGALKQQTPPRRAAWRHASSVFPSFQGGHRCWSLRDVSHTHLYL